MAMEIQNVLIVNLAPNEAKLASFETPNGQKM